MDYFALDKNDQLNKARKKKYTGYEEVCALQNEKIHIIYIILLMQLYWDEQEENKKNAKTK